MAGGNFIDLGGKKFYDGMPFIRAEDFYVLQTGDPEGPEEGYIDPKTKEYRAIPMEILVKDDDEPIYGFTLEEIGQYMDEPIFSLFYRTLSPRQYVKCTKSTIKGSWGLKFRG